MRIVYLQHEEFEDPAYLSAWAEKRGHGVEGIRAYEDPSFPNPSQVDMLWIMGGGMNVYEIDKHPWLVEEKRFIGKIIDARKHILGICLGAQLLADVLGAKVEPNPQKEIGWFPVELTPACRRRQPFRNMPHTMTAFHWHGDTFDIPRGAVHLGSSKACLNQGFVQGRILAIQFHPEVTEESVRRLTASCRSDLIDAPFVQKEKEILDAAHLHCPVLHGLTENLLDAWVSENN